MKLDVKAAEVARKIWDVLRIRTFQIIILQVGCLLTSLLFTQHSM